MAADGRALAAKPYRALGPASPSRRHVFEMSNCDEVHSTIVNIRVIICLMNMRCLHSTYGRSRETACEIPARTFVTTMLTVTLCIGAFVASAADEGARRVQVVTQSGEPLEGAVVYLRGDGADLAVSNAPAEPGVMDQIDRQFVPYILVVQRGAEVAFPNSDSIKHHVFSFSKAKKFQIKLYRGAEVDPVLFDAAGEVELGCNVHDWMLGYIYVVDTPYFARTDRSGFATLSVPDGAYEVGVWHPRMGGEENTLQKDMEAGRQSLRLQLPQALLPEFARDQGGEFSEYD